MKITIFLLLHLSLYAEIVMDNGQCFEKKGNMNYIVPCKKQTVTPDVISPSTAMNTQNDIPKEIVSQTKKNGCQFKIGRYAIEYTHTIENSRENIACDDTLQYIKSMFLGYEKTLSINKKKLGDLIVKRGFSSCNIELYFGDYISIGLMSGDKNMCNDFMVYHSNIKK